MGNRTRAFADGSRGIEIMSARGVLFPIRSLAVFLILAATAAPVWGQAQSLGRTISGPFWEHRIRVNLNSGSCTTVTINGSAVKDGAMILVPDRNAPIGVQADCQTATTHGTFTGQIQITGLPDFTPVLNSPGLNSLYHPLSPMPTSAAMTGTITSTRADGKTDTNNPDVFVYHGYKPDSIGNITQCAIATDMKSSQPLGSPIPFNAKASCDNANVYDANNVTDVGMHDFGDPFGGHSIAAGIFTTAGASAQAMAFVLEVWTLYKTALPHF